MDHEDIGFSGQKYPPIPALQYLHDPWQCITKPKSAYGAIQNSSNSAAVKPQKERGKFTL